jgi:SAM-dependent methyltransferase
MTAMVRDDRDHWNKRFTERPWPEEPSPWLTSNVDLLPNAAVALDVAGGTGRNALWLAAHGWDVTVADVSDVALSFATERATALDLPLRTELIDLSVSPLPSGPWDLVMLFHYLDKDLFPQIEAILAPGGVLVGTLATRANLERHERPPLPYLLEEGELPSLMGNLELVTYDEGWQNDHCDARFITRRPT